MTDSTEGWSRFLPHANQAGLWSEFSAQFAGQAVCVTGAAGDIGSALVRALAREELRSMLLVDCSEHGLFELQRQIEAAHPRTSCEYVLGSIDDRGLLDEIFRRHTPDVIFHAAAFKHLGLLEHNLFAAVQNNALGTYTLIRAALDNGVAKFLLLSTDKAVHPHSAMGVSKRIAELITVSISHSGFRANAIRLGNVIGSRGSVVPIFLDQIANGRPLPVTHADASRYFLLKDEAVRAILAAGAAACDGKILLPELAEPVRIADLARFLAKTYAGGAAAAFRITGLRPGEKMTEELVGRNETRAGMIAGPLTVVETERLRVSACQPAVERLRACVAHRDQDELVRCLCELVPEYTPSTLMRASVAVLV